jgi:hypothetical protein
MRRDWRRPGIVGFCPAAVAKPILGAHFSLVRSPDVFARVGRIDRRIRQGTSWLDVLRMFVTLDS